MLQCLFGLRSRREGPPRPDGVSAARELRRTATITTLGYVAILISVSGLLGWILGIPEWVVLLPGGSPMVFNTALGLLFCGSGVIALGRDAAGWSRIAGTMAAVLGAATFVQFPLGLDLGIDQFFWTQTLPVPMSTPGRMAPNTAVAFFLTGLGIVLGPTASRQAQTIAVVAAVTLAAAMLAITGYVFGLRVAFSWGGFTGMALPTATGFLCCSIALLNHAVRKSEPARAGSLRSLAFFSAAGAMVAIVGAAALVNSHVQQEAVRHGDRDARFELLARQADRMIILGFSLAGVFFAVAVTLTRRAQHARAAAESALRLTNASLEQRVWERTRELEVAKQHYRTVTETLPLLVWTCAGDGRCDWLGPQWTAYTGIPAEPQLEFGWLGQLHPEDRERTRRAWSDASSAGRDFDIEFRLRRHDGTYRWFKTRAVPLRDEGGAVVRWFGSNTDIQDQKDAQEKLAVTVAARTAELAAAMRIQRAIIDGTVYSIISTAPDGLIATFNQGAERMLGYTRDEMVGHRTPVCIHIPEEIAARATEVSARFGVEIAPGFEALVAAARRGEPDEREWTYLRKDGSRLPVSLSITALRDEEGTVTGFLGVAQDLTIRKKLELNLALARDEALAASRLKSEFLANMSHEIRTPMNGIIGMAALLAETQLNAEQQQMTRIIMGSSESLLGIIDDVLDLSKIEAGKLRMEPAEFELRELVEDTMALFRPRAAEKRLDLSSKIAPDVDGRFFGDGGRIRQVLMNLVSNAIKFTDQGRVEVQVSGRDGPRGLTRLRLEVTDTGIGIASEAHGAIFQAFSQVDTSTRRKQGGTGLGLTISRQLVELMGGQIGFESKEGQGSSFWFEINIPRRAHPQPAVPRAESPRPATRPQRRLRLLVAEDNPANQLVAQLIGTKLGHTVECAGDGSQALKRLAAENYDAVLMDCQMPHLDGYETTRRIRAAGLTVRNPNVPIIALTAYAMAGDREKCLAAGMNEYITKPVRAADLEAALHRLGLVDIAPAAPAPAPAGRRAGAPAVLDLSVVESMRAIPGQQGSWLDPELIAMFRSEVATLPGRISRLATRRRAAKLARIAHEFAGTCGVIGAAELCAALTTIERAATAGNWGQMPGLLATMEEARVRLLKALANLEEIPS